MTSEIPPPSIKSTCKSSNVIKVPISTIKANLPIVWIVSEEKFQFVAAALAQAVPKSLVKAQPPSSLQIQRKSSSTLPLAEAEYNCRMWAMAQQVPESQMP